MDFLFTPEEEAFRKEVRNFLGKEVTEAVRKEAYNREWGPASLEFMRKLGEKGWLGISWPKEYGGQEGSVWQEYILSDELGYQRGPYTRVATGQVGPTLLSYASEEIKREFLPKIARGEIHFALGYTEPEAGTDLASLQMRAVEARDCYIINGQKVFNTAVHYANYHWLLARTDPDASKHRGLSLFIVDLKSPGITIRPLYTMSERTNEVFYDNVRVPKQNLIGEKNKGWYYVSMSLGLERIVLRPPGQYQALLDELIQYAKETKRDGKLLAEDPVIRQQLAELAIEMEVARLLSYQAMCLINKGIAPDYQAAQYKIYLTEFAQRLARTGMVILGPYGQLEGESARVPLRGRLEHLRREAVLITYAAGSSEVLRTVMATRGLGLPRN